MSIAALFTIARSWKQPKCPATEEWINKLGSIHTTEYLAPLKRKENMAHATIWINLEDIVLSEISQVEWKDKYCMILLL